MFCLGKREFHLTSQRSSEMVAADRYVTNPDIAAVRYKQRRVISSHIQNDVVVFCRRWLRCGGRFAETQHVIRQIVVQRQRGDLDNLHFFVVVNKWLQSVIDQLSLHREQPDFCLEHKAALFDAATDRLIIPDHVVQIERNLLPCFIFHDLSHLAGFNWWQLDELRQRTLTGHADCNQIAINPVPVEKRFHGLPDKFFRNRIRLAEDFGMRNIVKRHRDHAFAIV